MQKSDEPHNCSGTQVREIIRHLEARALLPPLVVLQELARNRSLSLGVVRDYAARQLAAEVRFEPVGTYLMM